MFEENEACLPMTGQVARIHQPPKLTNMLEQEEENLAKKLEDVKRAQIILKENPAIEELMDIIQRSGRRFF